MDVLMFFFGVMLVLAIALWIWWNDGKTWQPLYQRVCRRIQSGLGVVSRDEMGVLQQQLQQKEHEWKSRLTKLEATSKLSSQLPFVTKEIERRLIQLERSTDSNPKSDPSSLVPQTAYHNKTGCSCDP